MIAITSEGGCGHCPASLVCWAGQPLVIRVRPQPKAGTRVGDTPSSHKSPFNARYCKRCHCVMLNDKYETYLCGMLRYLGSIKPQHTPRALRDTEGDALVMKPRVRVAASFNAALVFFNGCAELCEPYTSSPSPWPPHITTPKAEYHTYVPITPTRNDCVDHFTRLKQITKTY
jgi:hypothetical protein